VGTALAVQEARARVLADALAVERRRRRSRVALGVTLFAAAVMLAADLGGFDPVRLVAGLPRVGEFLTLLVPPIRSGQVIEDLSEWYWGLGKWLRLLGDTLLMALLATGLGTLAGALLSFPAAANLTPGPVAYWVSRRLLEFARAVPDLVFAIIFVFAFGLGPLAGVLAIALHTLGAQGKLFAEANENIDMKPLEGVRAAGGSPREEIVFGALPQVLPNWISFTFWRFEVNVRSATIIGFVGAGGIGLELYEALRLSYYDDAGAILLIVACTVFAIDWASEALRGRIMHGAAA
jgi:phosphonate transport system permease protein